MSKEQRVVITGIGALSPLGNDAKTTWDNALKGVNGIEEITRLDVSDFNINLAGELKDFNIEDHIEKKKHVVWIDLPNMQLSRQERQ